MRRVLLVPGVIWMFGSSALFLLGFLSWLSDKFGFIGVVVGLFTAPITGLVVPVWKGFATGNWWLVLYFPMFWFGSILIAISGVTKSTDRKLP